ncbi:MAG TPA: rhamnan synthesis F family protein [Acetobacteraceae bacterium]|nr:rhamnan synthesis F family protein [Acetobacteraceae bacterium]
MRTHRVERLLPYASAPLGRFRSHRQIGFAWPEGAVRLGPRIALVCHYDAGGRLRPDLLAYLRALRDAGFSVVLVSNSGTMHPDALQAGRALCAAVLVRRNLGLDFCAWRDAMEWLGLPHAGTAQLLLANDSVYGPLRPLAPLLARIGDAPGLWGMTDSVERGFHLQSYFLLAQADVIRSAAWQRFWRGVRPLRSKWLMIGLYEVGLTQRLLRTGLGCHALFSGVAGDGKLFANPTLDGWRILLDAGFPFLKRELLRDNPTLVPDLAAWRTRVTEIAGARAVAWIEADLAGRRTQTGLSNSAAAL